MRKFKVGELCLYRGKICRVLKVEPNSAKGHNPYLTLLALYGVDNKPVKKPKEVVAISGSVERVGDTIAQLKRDIEHNQARLDLLEQG